MTRPLIIAAASLSIFACAPAAPMQAPAVDSSPQQQDAPSTPGPDANGCTQQPCDILPQCGCAAGSACDFDLNDLIGTACRAVTVMGHQDAKCNFLADCDIDYTCVQDTGGLSSCHKYCTSNTDCALPRGQCVIDLTNGVTNDPLPGIPTLCSSGCDPLSTTSGTCATGMKCALFYEPHQGVTYSIVDCAAAGTGTNGANCKQNNMQNDALCAPGFYCTTTDGGQNYACRKMCDKTMPGTSCGNQTCRSFDTPFVLSSIEYGVCL